MSKHTLIHSNRWSLAAICLLISVSHGELPLKVRVDQALSQLVSNIQSNNFSGALPWLEQIMSFESEGFKLPLSMNFFAGQVYVKNGLNEKAAPLLEAYVNLPTQGKNFWDAVQLLAVASPTNCKAFLDVYLSKENPFYYQQALALYSDVETRIIATRQKFVKDSVMRHEDSLKRFFLIDRRDGNRYKIVSIGSQIWMAENLRYNEDGSKCVVYENDRGGCDVIGRHYNWKMALNACPEGWHLPTDHEWRILALDSSAGDLNSAKKLKSREMNGTNETGFNVIAAGYFTGYYNDEYNKRRAVFWTATENGQLAWTREFIYGEDFVMRPRNFGKSPFLSVRCLKN